jgi:hypothetical protein
MSTHEIFAFRDYLSPELKGRTISDPHHEVSLTDILQTTCLAGRVRELSGRSGLLAVSGQLLSALAMIELDGVARRMLLCPPDVDPNDSETLIDEAGIQAIVTDQPRRWAGAGVYLILGVHMPEPTVVSPKTQRATEWLMLTSGMSGKPKIVRHTLEEFDSSIVADGTPHGSAPVWATFHDIRDYGGLRILLRAVIGGGSMVLSEPVEPLAAHVARLAAHGVTHISGTPSHWRELLMSGSASYFSLRYVCLSGEIADQALLDELAHAFPNACIAHDAAAEPASALR